MCLAILNVKYSIIIWIPCVMIKSKWSRYYYSAYQILWLSPCDKIAQNWVQWLFLKCPKFHFISLELSSCDNYRPVTIFWPCPEVVAISDNYCTRQHMVTMVTIMSPSKPTVASVVAWRPSQYAKSATAFVVSHSPRERHWKNKTNRRRRREG